MLNKLNLLFAIKIICLFDKNIISSTTRMVDVLHSKNEYKIYRSVGLALVSCYCFIIVSAVIVLEIHVGIIVP